MASGLFPTRRHDGKAWRRTDHVREALSGSEMPARFILTQIKGDWAEFSKSLGFPPWNDCLLYTSPSPRD
eukprot:808853-Alexandrium_andersonii.AAC.1